MKVNKFGNSKGSESMYVPSKNKEEKKKAKIKEKNAIKELSDLDVPEVDEP